MALDILVTTDRINRSPAAREFIAFLQQREQELQLGGSALYYDFPSYSDYDTVTHKPDALLVSPRHGIVPIQIFEGVDAAPLSPAAIDSVDDSLGQFCSILVGRLLKSKTLRKNTTSLIFDINPVILCPAAVKGTLPPTENSHAITSLAGLEDFLSGNATVELANEVMAEIRSVIEGAKALTRPQKRVIEDPAKQSAAVSLSKLESEIANFDQKQRAAALVSIIGPQRIRGLAGSGKTVILAMKAAHLHQTYPDRDILVTFYTKSLSAAIKNLIAKFFRHYRDEDPNWKKIHVRHAWGGTSKEGAYSDACLRSGIRPLNYKQALAAAPQGQDPFDFACRDLINRQVVQPFYDHILIDEGQDFSQSFYELCFFLCRGARDEKNIVWAYDELQNILNIKIRTPEDLFGTDVDGQPRISLERTEGRAVGGATNDTVLSKCYRNQREVLVVAHALGFGIYHQIVQLLESPEHWSDVGYRVEHPEEFEVGKKVVIERPVENSPLSIDEDAHKIIDVLVAQNFEQELTWICNGVKGFIDSGLQPEDIMVITLDDRASKAYLKFISSYLANLGIATNNVTADPYNEPPFSIAGKVTLSTVYRAKGNEAAVVFASGIDAISRRARSQRNKIFTAFTRSKAWLRVSGVGANAAAYAQEIHQALNHFPKLEFLMPDLAQVDLIQRNLSSKQEKIRRLLKDVERELELDGLSMEDLTEALARPEK